MIVVGGGIVGASVAYHLAARGMRDVTVLDRASRPGEGSTGRATGGFRIQFANPMLIALSRLSRDKLRTFADETGGDAGFVPAGYLWVAETAAELATLRDALTVQRTNGVDDAVELDASGVGACNPALRRSPLAGGTFCASDGFVRPLQILDGYRRAAERLGVRFVWDCEVIALRRGSDGRIVAVQTPYDEIGTDLVVNAAGPWAASIAAMAGVLLPVSPLRRCVAITAPTDALPSTMPMTIYAGDGFHLRVRDGRALLLLPSWSGADPFDTSVENEWIDEVSRLARQRVPVLDTVPLDRAACWAGLYEMSPDGLPIVDAAPDVPNLFLANGSSGHGVMHAPAIGQLVAELIVDGAATSVDVRALRADRFVRGAAAQHELL